MQTDDYQEITLPLNFYSDILRPFVAKLAPTLDNDQQAIVRDAIDSHREFSDVLTEKFAPLVFYTILMPKVGSLADKTMRYPFEIDNVNCLSDEITAEANVDSFVFANMVNKCFYDEFAPYHNPQNDFVCNVSDGLAGYLLENHFDDLQVMLEPLLDGSEAAELVKSARLQALLSDSRTLANARACGFSEKSIKQIFDKSYAIIVKMINKKLCVPNKAEQAKVINFEHIINYIISTMNELDVNENCLSFPEMLGYAINYLDDCETFLANGAPVPLDLDEYIRIQQCGLLDDLHLQLGDLDAYCNFYLNHINPKVTSVVFTAILNTVASRTY